MPTPVWPVPSFTTTANSWKTISLENIVPTTADAVVVCFAASVGGSATIHARPTGQAQGYNPPVSSIVDGRGSPCMDIICKIGANRSIDITSNANTTIAVTSYFTTQEVNMLNVPQKINFTRNGTWQTVDMSSFIPNGQTQGYAAFVNIFDRTGWSGLVGWRRGGVGTGGIVNQVQGYVGTALVPMDELNRIDLFSSTPVSGGTINNNVDTEFWVTGFVSNREIIVWHDTPIMRNAAFTGTGILLPRYERSTCGIYAGITSGQRDRHTIVTPKGWPYSGGSYAAPFPPGTNRGTRNYGWRTYSCVPYGDPADVTAQASYIASSGAAQVIEYGYWKNLENSGLFFGTNF